MGVGFEGLKEMLDFNRSQKTIEEEDLDNKQCPYCLVPLKENEQGKLACPICLRFWSR